MIKKLFVVAFFSVTLQTDALNYDFNRYIWIASDCGPRKDDLEKFFVYHAL